jgi:hypothetical protein
MIRMGMQRLGKMGISIERLGARDNKENKAILENI